MTSSYFLYFVYSIVGEKQFLMGDEPCQNDCAIFGMMAQFYWMCPGPVERLVKGGYDIA